MKNIDAAVELLQTMHDVTAAAADGVDSGGIGSAIPISIKVHIAVNHCDLGGFLDFFVERLVDNAICQHFYLHACKVYMNGLYSPSQNCNIPPLDYPCNSYGHLPCEQFRAPYSSCIVPPCRLPPSLLGCLLG